MQQYVSLSLLDGIERWVKFLSTTSLLQHLQPSTDSSILNCGLWSTNLQENSVWSDFNVVSPRSRADNSHHRHYLYTYTVQLHAAGAHYLELSSEIMLT